MAGFGEAFLSTSLQVLFQKLASPALEELKKLYGVGDELGRLARALERIRAILWDAGRRQVEEESARLWLRDLKDAAIDAEDVLGEFEYEALKLQVEEGGGSSSRSSSSGHPSQSKVRKIAYSSSHRLPFRDLMARRIDKIHTELGEIERRGLQLGSLLGGGGFLWEGPKPGEMAGSRVQETASLLTEAQVFGRDREKEEIVQFLLASGCDGQGELDPPQPGFPRLDPDPVGGGDGNGKLEDLPLLAIVGMGGLGKTTVAQLVFNDGRVEQYFQLRMWVHVHQHFDVRRLTVHMWEHAAGPQMESPTPENLNLLQVGLIKKLMEKRFLLVLDDVWDATATEWKRLRAPLMFGGRGSRVIMTTRNANVSAAMGATKHIQLEQLPFEHSWSLFQRCAAVDAKSREGRSTLIMAVGKQIVEKLGGVPLAVKTVGGLLDKESDERVWQNVLESELWELQQSDGGILPALSLSYQHLPEPLKQCFAYCAVFPKDYRFDKLELVQLWMAQGFVPTLLGRKRNMEDVGSSYFNELCNRCFIQFSSSGKYVIHDVLHDLAQLVSKDENHGVQGGRWNSRYGKQLWHSSDLRSQPYPDELKDLSRCKSLRTLLYSPPFQGSLLSDMLAYFECLRVLDLSHSLLVCLPHSVGGLKHLRYLNLEHTGITELPGSLGSLYNLQTLKLEGCDELTSLPRSISRLLNLRHLEGKAELIFQTPGIGRLVHLQTLKPLSLSKGGGRRVGELKGLNELHGKLTIRNLQEVETEGETREARLRDKHHLDGLKLEWVDKWESNQRGSELEEAVLESLLPPPHLKKLTIKYYGGVWLPGWIQNNSFPYIRSISLQKCRNLTVIPSLETLPCLAILHVSDCPELTELGALPTALMELTTLNAGLVALPGLCGSHGVTAEPGGSQLRGNTGPSISTIVVSGCPKLVSLRGCLLQHRLSGLKVLRIVDCEELVYWPEDEFFRATILFLHSFEIHNCPKLQPWPERSVVPPQLKTLVVVDCPPVLNESFFMQLQNLTSTFIHVKKTYTDGASCIKEALRHMASVREMNLYYVDDILTSSLTVDESALVSLIVSQNTYSRFPLCSSELYVRSSTPATDDDDDAMHTNDRSMLNAYLQDHLSSLCDLGADMNPQRTSYVSAGAYAFRPHPAAPTRLRIP